MAKQKASKTFRQCCTCQYWNGCSVRVVSPNFIEYESSETATCNKTGHTRPAWSSCKDHEKRWDF